MTNTTDPVTYAAPESIEPSGRRSARATAALGLLAGAALVVDTVTITFVNHSFGVLDDALFLVGFAGMLLTVAALAVHVSTGRRGWRRVAVGLGVFVAVGVVLGGLSAIMDTIGRHVFSNANVGLHGEWSFFTIGLCLLGIAAWAHRR